ncbi:MAG: hypothetical protein H0T42_23230, partial [Deltaproteobacteria bacterium]|nr:hypothetical protein [Deltaproteobacteria bacterium]
IKAAAAEAAARRTIRAAAAGRAAKEATAAAEREIKLAAAEAAAAREIEAAAVVRAAKSATATAEAAAARGIKVAAAEAAAAKEIEAAAVVRAAKSATAAAEAGAAREIKAAAAVRASKAAARQIEATTTARIARAVSESEAAAKTTAAARSGTVVSAGAATRGIEATAGARAFKSAAAAESTAADAEAEAAIAGLGMFGEIVEPGEAAIAALGSFVEPAAAPPPVSAPEPVAVPVRSMTPPSGVPLRPPPAALAALQRASSNAMRSAAPRDPTKIPSIPPRPIPSPLPAPPLPAPKPIAVGSQVPTAQLAVSGRLGVTLAQLDAATTIDDACDAIMAFAAKRWSAALLLDVDGTSATGRRGHGAQISDDLAQWIVMTMDEPSLLQTAFSFSEVAKLTPERHGDVEDRLQRLLGMARAPSATAIIVGDKPAMLLAVGDAQGEDLQTATADLERLALGASAALTRLRRR